MAHKERTPSPHKTFYEAACVSSTDRRPIPCTSTLDTDRSRVASLSLRWRPKQRKAAKLQRRRLTNSKTSRCIFPKNTSRDSRSFAMRALANERPYSYCHRVGAESVFQNGLHHRWEGHALSWPPSEIRWKRTQQSASLRLFGRF